MDKIRYLQIRTGKC